MRKSGKKNHFAAVCKSNGKKKVNEIGYQNEEVATLTTHDKEGYLFIGTIENKRETENAWYTELEINNVKIKLKVDTGAMCNILTKTQLKTVGLSNIIIKSTNTLLRAYIDDRLQVTGICILMAKKNNRIYKIDFYVVETKTPAILGLSSCLELEIIEKIDNINEESSYAGVLKEYKEI